jgi:pyruvate formate lyase activating enzyme
MESKAVKIALPQEGYSPVYALLRKVSMIDYPGRLCRVLFLAGCNLDCVFCHNQELIQAKTTTITWERLRQILLESRENWVDAVTITGGEPTIHPDLKELILWVRNLGFKVKLDTNGVLPEALKEVLPLLDYVAMDYKAPLERYRMMTANPYLNLEDIRESVKLIIEWGGQYEFRTTVVHDLHTEEDMLAICRELKGAKRFVIQGYVPPREGETDKQLPPGRTPMVQLRKYQKLCQDYFGETILRGA